MSQRSLQRVIVPVNIHAGIPARRWLVLGFPLAIPQGVHLGLRGRGRASVGVCQASCWSCRHLTEQETSCQYLVHHTKEKRAKPCEPSAVRSKLTTYQG